MKETNPFRQMTAGLICPATLNDRSNTFGRFLMRSGMKVLSRYEHLLEDYPPCACQPPAMN